MGRLHSRYLIIAVSGLFLWLVRADAPAAQQKRVLVLYSYHDGVPWEMLVDRGLRTTFETRATDMVALDVEHMDLIRYTDEGYVSEIKELYRRKYAGKALDLIISMDAESIDFLIKHGMDLFPGVPVVFASDEQDFLRADALPSNITGIFRGEDYRRTLDLALDLKPGTRHVYVISGSSLTDSLVAAKARTALRSEENRVSIHYWSDLPVEDILDQVSSLPEHSLVLYLIILRDAEGNPQISNDVLLQISTRANAPVFSLWDTYLGHGVFGGVMTSAELQGQKVAELALEILAGTSPNDIELSSLDNVPMFDWRQMKRWGVSEQQLPPGSIVRFREHSLFEQYRRRILGGVFIILAQSVLIVFIIVLSRHRRRAEKKAREHERQLGTVLGNLQGMVYRCLYDEYWTMLYLSDGCVGLTGYQPEDLILNSSVAYNELIHQDDRIYARSKVGQVLHNGKPFKLNYRIRTAAGDIKWVYEQGVVLAHPQNGSRVIEGYITDITNMELAKAELTEKVNLLALTSETGTILSRGGSLADVLRQCCDCLVNNLDVACARIWLLDAEGRLLELQAGAGLCVDIDGEHGRIPVGKGVIGGLAESKKPLLNNSILDDPRFDDQSWVRRNNMVSFAGQPLMVSGKVVGVMAIFAASPFTENVGKALAAVADGIAMGVERTRYEDALSRSEARLKTLVQAIPDLVWLKDLEGVYQTCNSKFQRFFGASEAEIVGKTDYDFLSRELADSFRRNDQIAISRGRPSMNEEEVVYADDGHLEYLETIKTPMIDARGKVIGVLGISRDITERKKALETKESLEKQLRQAHKMEAIGTLAGGIAHDFNNILSAIYGYAELAYEDMADPDVLKQDLDEILKGADRARHLVRQILTFSRKTDQEEKALQISLVAKEAVKLLRSSIPTTIDILQDIDSDALVLADPTQIHQVVMNLCTNAYQVMREKGGTLGISLKEIEVAEYEKSPGLKIEAGRYLRLEVSDTGKGMDEVIKAKIFEPYFTTKEPGEGTGLGLAVVHGIVESHGGHINVYSEPGQGTTFHVYFPVYSGERPEAAPEVTETPLLGGREAIMIVDDDIEIIETSRRLLTRHGYEVHAYLDSNFAYRDFARNPEKYDLIFTDMTMPMMTGVELAQKVFGIRPEMPVILCSGHSELINRENALALGIRDYCYKPLNKNQMLISIRKTLDSANGS